MITSFLWANWVDISTFLSSLSGFVDVLRCFLISTAQTHRRSGPLVHRLEFGRDVKGALTYIQSTWLA